MKFIKKLLITLLLLSTLLGITVYALLQTTLGARWAGQVISAYTPYQLTVGKISHNLGTPLQFTLSDLTLARGDSPPFLHAKRAVVGLRFQSALLRSLPYVELQNGDLSLAGAPLPLRIEQLRLQNMAFTFKRGDWQIGGDIKQASFASETESAISPFGFDGPFTLSAQKLVVNNIAASAVLIQGNTRQGLLSLDDFGADIAQGQLTGKAQQLQDGSWIIDNVRLSRIRLQFPQHFSELWQQIASLPKIEIKRFDLLDAKLEGLNWALSEFNLNVLDTTLWQGDWTTTNKGMLSSNATHLVVDNLSLSDPFIKLAFSKESVAIQQFTGRWQEGLFRMSGTWLHNSGELRLDELTIAALEYPLPADWRTYWQQPLPAWLSQVSIKKLAANRNLLIDTQLDFPFQIGGLDGYGQNLLLVKDRRLGFWQGNLTLNAGDATFNKIDVRRPSLKLTAENQQLRISDLSGFTQSGILEATAQMQLTEQQPFSLKMEGKSVELSMLNRWGWPDQLFTEKGDFSLELNGQAADTQPLLQTLQGKLAVTHDEKQSEYQLLKGKAAESQAAQE